MATPLQLWLSSRPPRTNTASDSIVHGPDNSTDIKFETHGDAVYTFETHKVSHRFCRGNKNAQSGPGRHIHIDQTEEFIVLTGAMGAEVDGKEVILRPGDPPLIIQPRLRHRFWPIEGHGDLTMRVNVSDPLSGGFDEQFLRNVIGYISDCDKEKTSPSLFQLMLFFYPHGILLALPLPISILIPLHQFGAFIAEKILGYSQTYPEYYSAAESAKRK